MQRALLVSLLCIGLSGCGAKFVYNHLDWFSQMYVDDYVELNPEQQIYYDQAFDALWQWHRERELPHYLSHLQQLQSLDLSQVTQDQVALHSQTFRAHWQRLIEEMEPHLFAMGEQLSHQQFRAMLAVAEKENIEQLESYQKLSPEQRLSKRQKRIEKFVKRWLGSISPAQKQIIGELTLALHDTTEEWIAHRRKVSQTLSYLYWRKDNPEQLREGFHRVITQAEYLFPQNYQDKLDANQQRWQLALVAILRSTTPKQQDYFTGRLRYWQKTLEALTPKRQQTAMTEEKSAL
ncbi:DUF6279 family lipoprotein [Aliagarivorans taiwanensis]|uniref:DUF6279 family lipoprotein n=1 Tax=Aliagarivorans taiwanensis TaxID=561966 RepID=UPI0003FE8859|nr:DUF6279 family lipoprotein [Aliagarivorans taiwanensis]